MDNTEYAVLLHIEEHHTEESPFAVQAAEPDLSLQDRRATTYTTETPRQSSSNEPWMKCTRAGCNEYVHLTEVDEHLEIHEAITAADDDGRGSSHEHSSTSSISLRTHRSSPPNGKLQRELGNPPKSKKPGSLWDYFTGGSLASSSSKARNPLRERQPNGRLGTKDLGPHAFEKSMPNEVRRRLKEDARPRTANRIGRDGKLNHETAIPNETSDLIPILADLSDLDPAVRSAYFCSRSTKHIHKLSCEGNFCGYWNIQMLLSYLRATDTDVVARDKPLPNVLQIQEVIEEAWDAGTCTYGRIETGGIRNSRKWIGTHEAAAYFMHTQRPVQALSFKSSDDAPAPAHIQLLDWVEAYLLSSLEDARKHGSSAITALPPIFFQRAGHSMTIVGLERRKDGGRNLLIFDPSFATTSAMMRLVDGKTAHSKVETLMAPYRHGAKRLERWKEYEVLTCIEP